MAQAPQADKRQAGPATQAGQSQHPLLDHSTELTSAPNPFSPLKLGVGNTHMSKLVWMDGFETHLSLPQFLGLELRRAGEEKGDEVQLSSASGVICGARAGPVLTGSSSLARGKPHKRGLGHGQLSLVRGANWGPESTSSSPRVPQRQDQALLPSAYLSSLPCTEASSGPRGSRPTAGAGQEEEGSQFKAVPKQLRNRVE